MASQPSPAPQASLADKMVGGWGGRMWLGAASPLIAGAQAFGGEGVRAKLAELQQMKQRGMAAEGKEGTDWYGMLGQALPATGIASGVAKALPAATGLLGKMGIGAAQGAAAAAATPSGGVTAEEYFPNKAGQVGLGAAMGGIVSGGIEGAKKLKDAVQPITDMFTGQSGIENIARRGYERIIGEKGMPVVAKALQGAKQIIPGSQPTAAEAVAGNPAGTSIQALQKLTAQTAGGPSVAFGHREMQNQSARERIINAIAGGRSQSELEAVRESAAQSMYPPALQKIVTSDSALEELLRRPSMSKALARAADLAKDKGDVFQIGKNVPAQTVASPILSKSGTHYTSTVPEQVAKYPVQSLHYVKKALDDMVKNPERFGIGKSEEAAVLELKNKLLEWTGKHAPDYTAARKVFELLSKPVNRAQVRDALADKLRSSTGNETPGTFVKAVDQSAQMLKKATGNPRYETIEDVLRPREAKMARLVAEDAERKLSSLHPVQPTSLQGMEDITSGNMPHLSLLSRPVVIANALLKHLGKSSIEPKVDALNTELLLNPKRLGEFLSSYPSSSKYHPIMNALSQSAPGIAGSYAGRE